MLLLRMDRTFSAYGHFAPARLATKKFVTTTPSGSNNFRTCRGRIISRKWLTEGEMTSSKSFTSYYRSLKTEQSLRNLWLSTNIPSFEVFLLVRSLYQRCAFPHVNPQRWVDHPTSRYQHQNKLHGLNSLAVFVLHSGWCLFHQFPSCPHRARYPSLFVTRMRGWFLRNVWKWRVFQIEHCLSGWRFGSMLAEGRKLLIPEN